MNILHYSFQKGHFKGSSKKKGAPTKNFGSAEGPLPLPTAPEGL